MTSLLLVVVPFAAFVVAIALPDRSPYRRTDEPVLPPKEDT